MRKPHFVTRFLGFVSTALAALLLATAALAQAPAPAAPGTLSNGDKTLTGSGAAVLGNPLTVVAWLANELPKFGRRLSKGDRITTGVTTDIYLARPGDRLVADFGRLGKVSTAFDSN